MAVNMFASIYIGSYEVSLKVFEISQRKKIKEIEESVRSVFNEYCETENIKCFRIKRVDK